MRTIWGLTLLATLGCAGGSALPDGGLSVVITSHRDGDPVADAFVLEGTATGGAVEVAVDAGPFVPADGAEAWSLAIDASAWTLGYHTVQARVVVAGRQALARVNLYCENDFIPPPLPDSPPAPRPGPEPPRDMIAHWTLENRTGSDASGSGFDGTVYGLPEMSGAGCLGFDGVDDYVAIPAAEGPAPAPIGDLQYGTIAARFRFDSILNGKRQAEVLPILWYGADETRSYLGTDGVILCVGHGGIVAPTERQMYFTVIKNGMVALCFDSTISVTLGAWHHYVVVIGPDGHRAYLDGVEMELRYNAGSTPETHAFFATVATRDLMSIGYAKDALSQNWCWFPGALDDVRIYDRALSASEVGALYSHP